MNAPWFGVGPPPDLPDDRVAAWYWDQVAAAVDDHERGLHYCDPDTPSYVFCGPIQDLIVGATQAGVCGHVVPVAGFPEPVPLRFLLAPFRWEAA